MSDLLAAIVNDEALPDAVASRLAAEQKRLEERLAPARRRGEPLRHVLVVGGSGYIGGPLISHLLQAGCKVTNLDRLVYDHGVATMGALMHPAYRFVYGDMGEKSDLDKALLGVTDVVILAGLVGDPITRKFPEASAEINDRGITRCIDALAGRGLERVIFVSTCSNYGLISDNARADENFPLSPLSLYAQSKVAVEQRILSLKGTVDYVPTVLRFATAFGLAPRMRFDLTVNEFTRELALDRELVVFDAHTWRPYCHVRDFARLITRVLAFPSADVAFEVFNAGGDSNNHTKQSIVDLILARLPGRRVAYRSNSADQRNYRVDFAKVRKYLYFEPRYSVDDGVQEIIWALSNGLMADVDARANLYGNYALPGLDKNRA